MRSKINYILIVLVFNFLILSCACYGFEKDGLRFTPSPHCGLYCVYGSARYIGTDIDFVDLVKPEYVGSAKGSSLNELMKCVEDVGLKAKAIQNINSRFLRQITWPVILHVKEDYFSQDYSHYVLFMGTENDKAIVLDSSEKKIIPFSDLLPLMDGIGLVVSNEAIDWGAVFWPGRKRFIINTGFVIGFILVVRWLRGRWRISVKSVKGRVGLSMAEGMGLGIAAIIFGMVFHFVNEAGFLAHAGSTAGVQQAYAGTFIPKVDKEKVAEQLGRDTVFVDARYSRDYEAGHMDGAISVPVDCNDAELEEAMAGTGKDAKIVVYCQSSGCPYAEKVSIRLKRTGYNDVSIFKGGWVAWEEH
jgi:rhodanese-related sulfurtransferase